GRVARRAIRIFEPREDDFLVRLGVDCLAEVGELALGHVAVPGLDRPRDTQFADHRCELGRVLLVGILVRLGHGQDESFKVGHAAAPSGSGWGSLAAKTASWSASARWNAGRASARAK